MSIASQHYENFPVASSLLPRQLRNPVAVIYAFARMADDYADEGDANVASRLHNLDGVDERLRGISAGDIPNEPVFIALADVIQGHDLPIQLFHDLVSAFRQDVTVTRYNDFAGILDYCRRSANPVGRLLLHLAGVATEKNCQLSDNVCTALQLVNFYQDIAQDYMENNRIYLALDEMHKAGITEQHIAGQISDTRMREFMAFQYQRASVMLCQGLPLTHQMGFRLNLEIRATIHGGLRITEKLIQSSDVFSRPRLTRLDWLRILARTLLPNRACSRFRS